MDGVLYKQLCTGIIRYRGPLFLFYIAFDLRSDLVLFITSVVLNLPPKVPPTDNIFKSRPIGGT